MQGNHLVSRPAEWPRDDSWLFADPMSIGGVESNPAHDGWPGGDGSGARRDPARTGRRVWTAAMAGILAGVVLGVSGSLIGGRSVALAPAAAVCSQDTSAGSNPAEDGGGS